MCVDVQRVARAGIAEASSRHLCVRSVVLARRTRPRRRPTRSRRRRRRRRSGRPRAARRCRRSRRARGRRRARRSSGRRSGCRSRRRRSAGRSPRRTGGTCGRRSARRGGRRSTETVTASVASMIPTTTRPPVRRWRNAPAATTAPIPMAATASAIVHGTSVPVASSSASAPAPASRRPNTGRKSEGCRGARTSVPVSGAGSPSFPRRCAITIAAPPSRSSVHAKPLFGQKSACATSETTAIATRATPARSQGRSRWRLSASEAIESVRPSSGMTSAAAT